MGVFFNGRLWITPATMSVVDDSAMFNKNLSVGNVQAVVGPATGGKPNTPLSFGSPSEAKALLRSGDLLDCILKAFDPSSETGSPATVIAIRVNPAVQAALMLKDASAGNVINLQSTDYGLWTNGIKAKVEAGSTAGLKLSTQVGNDYFSEDNVARSAFSVIYGGGEATAVMTIDGTQVILEAPANTSVAVIALAAYPTVQALVDRINVVSGFTAVVLDGNGSKATPSALDFVTGQNVKVSHTATAHLQAAVDWFNGAGEGFVTATRQAAAGKIPAVLNWTYLAGGTDGTTTNTEWSDAYTTLQTEDVQWVVPASSSSAIHAMNDTHCAFMSNVVRMERRGICGTASATTDDAALTATKALNSDRTSLVHLGFYDYNAAGALVLFEPFVLAAQIAGAFCGVNPGTAMTNKSLKIRGLERKLRNPTDTDKLIKGGVLCVEETNRGYRVVKSISTWLNNENYNRVEVSCGVAVDFVARNVRNALDTLRGAKGNAQTMALALTKTETTLAELARPEPQGPGVLAGNEESPPYKGITVSLDGDVMRVDFECSPVIPVNYTLVSIFAVPFSSTVAA